MTMDPGTAAAVARTRSDVCDLHALLVENNLVAWTSGNVSAKNCPDEGGTQWLATLIGYQVK